MHVTFQIGPPPILSSSALLSYSRLVIAYRSDQETGLRQPYGGSMYPMMHSVFGINDKKNKADRQGHRAGIVNTPKILRQTVG